MEHAIVTLKKGEGRTIKAGGAWIYDNEIANVVGSFDDGDVVLVHDFDGYPMGKGYINRHSKIRVRMLTRHQEQEIDDAFWKMRRQPSTPRAAVLFSERRISCRDSLLISSVMFLSWSLWHSALTGIRSILSIC